MIKYWVLTAALFLVIPCLAWTQQSPLDPGFSAVEKAWLAAHPKIRLGIAPNSPPIEWIDEKGVYTGIGADYVRLLEYRLGVELVPVGGLSWAQALQKAREGEIDVLPALARSPERETFLTFTEPILQLPMVVITRVSETEDRRVEDLNGVRTAMAEGWVSQEWLSSYFPGVIIQGYPDVRRAEQAVVFKEVEALICDLASATYAIDRLGVSGLKVSSQAPYIPSLCMGVRKDWPILVGILNKALASIRSDEKAAIRTRWIAFRQAGIDLRRVLVIAIPILAALVFVILLVANRRMSAEVRHPRRVEEALREQERQFRSLAENIPDIVSRLGRDLRYTYINPAIEKLSGLPPAHYIGKAIEELGVSERISKSRKEKLDQVLSNGVPASFESEYELPGGKRILSSLIVAEPDEIGTVRSLLMVSRDITAQKRAEQEVERHRDHLEEMIAQRTAQLSNSEERFRILFERSPDAILIAEAADLRFLFINQAASRLLGRERGELLNEGISDIHPPETLPRLLQGIRAIEPEATARFFDVPCVRGDGLNVTVDISSTLLTIDGRACLIVQLRDITDRKAVEDQLRKLSRAVEQSLSAVVITDQDGSIEYVNPAFCRITGYAADEVRGANPRILKSGIHPTEVYAALWNTIKAGKEWRGEMCSRAKNGELYWELTSISPLRDESGAISHFVAVKQDITQSREVEEALRTSEKRFAFAMEGTNDGVWDHDLQNDRFYYSTRWKSMLGYADQELEDGPDLAQGLTPPEEWARLVAESDTMIEKGAVKFENEFSMRHKDGHLVNVLARTLVVRDEHGTPTRLVGTHTDLTERMRAARELREAKEAADAANRAKSDFLANMSHEIRTPMNAVIGFANLALRLDMPGRLRDYVTKIHEAGVSLLGLINDILDFSKVEAGKLTIESVDFDLDEVLRRVNTLNSQRASDKGLEFLLHIASNMPRSLAGDPVRLGQVLTNLVSNALKFTESGEVELSAMCAERTARKAKLQFSVRDTGIGMSSDQCARMFQAFTQADSSTTRKYGGTGLGLSISKRFVELMGGQIWVESIPGKGSTFSFTAWLDVRAEARPPLTVIPATLNGMRVLVVDDNPAARNVLQELLQEFPFVVDTVVSGERALEAVKEADETQPYGLVLMDWRMPGMDGLEAARRLRDEAGLRHVPAVVIVTALMGGDAEHAEVKAAGVKELLIKPVTASTLTDSVIRIFAPHQDSSARTMGREGEYQTLAGARVLLAEDNEINQQIAVELLQQAGAEVEVAANGSEAVQKLRDSGHSFDFVLMDVQMPTMDGYEATRLIRADPRFSALPIIALTAHAMAEERQRAMESGMNDQVTKPIDPQAMFQTLNRFYSRAAEGAPPGGQKRIDEGVEVPATTYSASFPALPGVDVATGLLRSGGNGTLYRKLLSMFEESQKGAIGDIRHALQEKDRSTAERIAHTLKGVAGNLGADAVQRAAAALEKSIRENKSPRSTRKLIGDCEAALGGVLHAIGQLASLNTDGGQGITPGRSADPALVRRAVERMRVLVQDSDSAAVEYLEEVRVELQAAWPAELFRRLEKALHSYDFSLVLEVLKDCDPGTLMPTGEGA